MVACYEAGVSGYDLYRQITALGVPCQVIAPALTPRRPGQRIKTDRRDAAKLVRLFRAGELTPIHVPDESEEAVRDLLRCRDDVRRDVLRWRHRVVKFLARHGRVYRAGRNWSQRHWRWIREQQFALPALQRTLDASLFALEQALARLADLDQEIVALADTAPYRTPVGWLRCFRGIDTLSAMILVAEIVDFQRFRGPRQLMAYLGLVPSEYSSGDRRAAGGAYQGRQQPRAARARGGGLALSPPAHVGGALARRSRANPARSPSRPGARSNGCTAVIASSSGTANAPRWQSRPWPGSSWASSGPR